MVLCSNQSDMIPIELHPCIACYECIIMWKICLSYTYHKMHKNPFCQSAANIHTAFIVKNGTALPIHISTKLCTGIIKIKHDVAQWFIVRQRVSKAHIINTLSIIVFTIDAVSTCTQYSRVFKHGTKVLCIPSLK